MYKGVTSSTDIMKSIEGFDLFNSEKILKYDGLVDSEVGIVSKFEGRLDLLVNDKYGNYYNYGLIGILNRIEDPSNLYLGRKLLYPSVDQLYNIMENDV